VQTTQSRSPRAGRRSAARSPWHAWPESYNDCGVGPCWRERNGRFSV